MKIKLHPLAVAAERAVELAYESVWQHGIDMPVGAIALSGPTISGEGIASDKRTGYPMLHAEVYALNSAELGGRFNPPPDILVSTMEPCRQCRTVIPSISSVRAVYYLLGREDVESAGLVRAYTDDEVAGLPPTSYASLQLPMTYLKEPLQELFGTLKREHDSGALTVDRKKLEKLIAKYGFRFI